MAEPTSGIFICYRRDPDAHFAGRLYDPLARRVGRDRLFMDIDNLKPGQVFADVLRKTLDKAAVVVVLIGRDWLTCKDAHGRTKLTNPKDFVRLEVSTALTRNVWVIPVLIDDARLPEPEELPEEMAGLSERQAIRIHHDRFQQGAAELIEVCAEAQKARGEKTRDWRFSPKWVLGFVAIVVIAAAGYFGVSRFGKPQPDAAANESSQTTAPSVKASADARENRVNSNDSNRSTAPPAPTATAPPVNGPADSGEKRVISTDSNTPHSTPQPGTPATAPPVLAAIRAGDTKVNSKDGLTYVWIPQGSFMMGCSPGDNECYDDEKPAHRVTITKAFWLGRTAVTQAAYQRVRGNNPSTFKGDSRPVEEVTWSDANDYCGAIGGRLPTEAEWEYAARAGTTGAWYGNLDDIAWYSDNSGSEIHDVAQKKPNNWGLYDMLGNVWQWTADWYDGKY